MNSKLEVLKIDDVLELVKLVHRVHMETKHFANIEFSNHGWDVTVTTMKGAFSVAKPYSLFECFNLCDSDHQKENIKNFLKIRKHLKELLGEEK